MSNCAPRLRARGNLRAYLRAQSFAKDIFGPLDAFAYKRTVLVALDSVAKQVKSKAGSWMLGPIHSMKDECPLT